MGGVFNIATLGVMYAYGFDLFFDFAGYSMFALVISNLMGVKSPVNFNQPFKSRDLKEFWNRWHMSLSFWFRDFVFMRLVKVLVKHKVFKNRKRHLKCCLHCQYANHGLLAWIDLVLYHLRSFSWYWACD